MATDDPATVDPAVRRRSTRDRPAKPPLGEAVIVDAALAILKSEGLDAVTMRRVARALDTGPASLYVYMSGREALIAAMLDRVTATVRLDRPDPSRWRKQLHALLARMLDALLAHPGIVATTLAGPLVSDAILQVTENLLGLLFAGGIDPQDAAWACDILVALVTATAVEDEARRAGGDFDAQVSKLEDTFSNLPRDRFPLLSAHAAEMVAGDTRERFRFGIDAVLDGVLARQGRR